MPKACTVRPARNSGRNAKRGVAHRSDGSRRYSTFGSPRPLSVDLAARRRPRGDRIKKVATGVRSLLQCTSPLMARSGVRRSANQSVAKGSKRTSPGHSLPLPGVLHDARALAQMILDPL